MHAPIPILRSFSENKVGEFYCYFCARAGVRDEDWGRIMEVADPFGSKLRFWQRASET
ncbi:hypothetical protein [Janthinobacterium sp. PC23-8]|uniref:hypothetical protein n=1 Tax=Janthinobacterium sp. PC23-8 TaxID=2012679 RepID=UPI0015953597|nr:hypothetical protein [Janthinobacterium sp. PC23-8]